MNVVEKLNQTPNPFISSFYGVCRAGVVMPALHPLDVVKVKMQTSKEPQGAFHHSKKLWQQGGVKEFYKGFQPQFLRMLLKQVWCWPIMTTVPKYWEKSGYHCLLSQALTGATIGLVDASISTPLDRLRVLAITQNKKDISFTDLKKGWRGFPLLSLRLTTLWSSFLVSQKYFREQEEQRLGVESLEVQHLIPIGMKTAGIACAISAPLDLCSNLYQSKEVNYRTFLNSVKKLKPTNFYRGMTLTAGIMITHNFTSVYFLDRLKN